MPLHPVAKFDKKFHKHQVHQRQTHHTLPWIGTSKMRLRDGYTTSEKFRVRIFRRFGSWSIGSQYAEIKTFLLLVLTSDMPTNLNLSGRLWQDR